LAYSQKLEGITAGLSGGIESLKTVQRKFEKISPSAGGATVTDSINVLDGLKKLSASLSSLKFQ